MADDAARASTGDRTGGLLAAGFGSRLRDDGTDSLKPLTPVAGVPLLVRSVRSLEHAGCSRVVLVLGFGAEAIDNALQHEQLGDAEIVTRINPHYELKNGLSLLAAAPELPEDGEFVLMMADHVVGDEVMAEVRAHRPPDGGATLLVDRRIDEVFDLDDATKVVTDGDRLALIGKGLDGYDAVDTGIFVCTTGLLEAVRTIYAERGDASISDAVQALSDGGRMSVLPVDGFWQDVDDRAMLDHAEAVLRTRGEG